MTQVAHHTIEPDMQQCIQECQTCHSVCLATVQHCLQASDAHAEATYIRLLLDCAEICQTSANFMLRGSELYARTCGVCVEVCDRCAQSCARLGDDPQAQACGEACRHCSDSCRRMVAMAS